MTKPFLVVLSLLALSVAPNVAEGQKKSKASRKQASKQESKTDQALLAKIDKLLDDGKSAQAFWGVLVVDLADGKTIVARNEHRLFAPASNTKLYTTAAALDLLGPSYKFRTTLEAAAPPDAQGRIAGNLILVGRGDPNLSPRVMPYKDRAEISGAGTVTLDRLADQLLAAGVRAIDGDVIGDDTYFVFDRYPEGWTVDDTIWSYGAPISALTINDNTVWADIHPGERPGDPAQIKIEPFQGYFAVQNRVVTAGTSAPRRISVNREPGSHVYEFWGRIPAGDSGMRENLAVDDPAELAAHYLRDALIARGVSVKGRAEARHRRAVDIKMLETPTAVAVFPNFPAPTILAAVESVNLAESLKVINKISQNLHAEIMLRTIGVERPAKESRESDTPGSLGAGLATRKEFLTKAGVLPEEYYLLDGSGLSRANLVAPAATVRLLTYMDASAHREAWLDTLPIGGVDGSLNNRLKTTCTVSNVFAKTGTIRHVSALSGYLTTSHKRRLAFSLMVNNHNMPGREATGIMDKVLDELCQAH